MSGGNNEAAVTGLVEYESDTDTSSDSSSDEFCATDVVETHVVVPSPPRRTGLGW